MSRTIPGAKASLKLNGVKVVFVGSVNINHENSLANIEVLDQLEVAEIAAVGHNVSFSCNLFKVDENAAKALGLDPDNLDDLLSQADLTMEVYNRIEDKVEYTMSGVVFEGGSGSLDARSVWSGVWNFRGKRGQGI